MKQIKKFLFYSLVLSIITGCAIKKDDNTALIPKAFPITPPTGPAIYQQGWLEGCHSGLASANELIPARYRIYSHHIDQELQYNKMYWRVWQDAYNYCAFTMLTVMKYNNS